MQIYDTMSKKKKELKPLKDKRVDLFVCGPTVYDYSHIGHGRTYIFFDAFVKHLKQQGFESRYIQNITDLDDKIIQRAKEIKRDATELARNFETEYYHDMEKLDITSVDKYARATDYIPQIISQVERLIKSGYAYEIEGDGIYFDISKFKEYGKLSGRTAKQAEDAISRIDNSINKKNKGDFALWKLSNPPVGEEPKWKSPWGEGRPGWHIEDTAITECEFGTQYDIHGGARDLIFPHHESEIAQMEAISGKEPIVNYWMHTGFLTVAGEKMSKSLGNYITIHEFLNEHSKEAFRLFVLSSHYRSPVDFIPRSIKQAEANTKKFSQFKQRLEGFLNNEKNFGNNQRVEKFLRETRREYEKKLRDDFNTPKALAAIFNLIRKMNQLMDDGELNKKGAEKILSFLTEFNVVFGVIPKNERRVPDEIKNLAKERENLRRQKMWGEADELRQKIERAGYTVKDTASGWKIS